MVTALCHPRNGEWEAGESEVQSSSVTQRILKPAYSRPELKRGWEWSARGGNFIPRRKVSNTCISQSGKLLSPFLPFLLLPSSPGLLMAGRLENTHARCEPRCMERSTLSSGSAKDSTRRRRTQAGFQCCHPDSRHSSLPPPTADALHLLPSSPPQTTAAQYSQGFWPKAD